MVAAAIAAQCVTSIYVCHRIIKKTMDYGELGRALDTYTNVARYYCGGYKALISTS